MKKVLKILKWIGIVILSIIILFLIVRLLGKMYYNRTPEGGINEAMYIDVNGQQQWINIYGEDRNNPVMLYLHGGPGNATSFGDWVIFRKLAKDYTIVNWDQRNSGLTWIHDPQDTAITPELMRRDIDAVADYVLDCMDKEKLTILGMSWGSIYGADFALRHPEQTECVIELSLADQMTYNKTITEAITAYADGSKDFRAIADAYGYDVFFTDSRILGQPALIKAQREGEKNVYLKWTENDPEYHKLAEQIDPELFVKWYQNQDDPDLTKQLTDSWEKYKKPIEMKYETKLRGAESFSDTDVSLVKAIVFNPYFTLRDWLKWHYDTGAYEKTEKALFEALSLETRTEYEMPFYVLEGSRDQYDIGHCQAQYFNRITAPDKAFRYIDGTHMSTMLHSAELADFVHEIAEKQKIG